MEFADLFIIWRRGPSNFELKNVAYVFEILTTFQFYVTRKLTLLADVRR